MVLWPQDSIKDKAFTNSNCVQTAPGRAHGASRNAALELPKRNAFVPVQAINTSGRVALYGLYFESGKADGRPKSNDTLHQIARLLAAEPVLKLLVVGHTDNIGEFAAKLDLSKRRAEAVISMLTIGYKADRKRLTAVGLSLASPVAPNARDDGKAKNRWVELVPNN